MNGPGSLAAAVIAYLEDLFGCRLPLRLRVWDGSEAGDGDGVAVSLHSPVAMRYLLWRPGELGLARAYVTGALDVEGDLEGGIERLRSAVGSRRAVLTAGRVARGLALIARSGGVGAPPRPPMAESRPRGRPHSPRRDSAVISRHYDIGNDFYRLILDPSMAYSCGYWSADQPGLDLADAQRDKLELICRKLALRPGSRLLDIGCGWGALTVHAASRYGAEVTAVTVAREQEEFVRNRLEREGVAHLVDLRRCDYREVLTGPGESFDAMAVIEMGEHVGAGNYPAFLAGLHAGLRDGGRFLLQVMSRPGRHRGGGPFIERYIAADMDMRPLAATLEMVQGAGFEVRDVHAMREHYARTTRAWVEHLERRWGEAVDLLGEERARVWRLYLVGAALSFEQNRMGVDQVLCTRTAADGRSGMGLTRSGWELPGPLMAAAAGR